MEPLPPLNREFDYHRIAGGDAAYRENYDRIFRKKLTDTEESEKRPPTEVPTRAEAVQNGDSTFSA